MNPQPDPKRAIGIGISIGILIVFVAFLSIRCDESESPVSFTPDLPDASTFTGSSSSSNTNPPTTTPEVQPPRPTRCEVVWPLRNSIEVETDGLTVRMKVPVEWGGNVDPDDIIVYVWLPRVNDGEQKGPFPHDEWFEFTVDEYKTYSYQIAVEVDTNGDGRADDDMQCDRHNGRFTTRRPPVCPNPPCNPPPLCEEQLRIEVETDDGIARIFLYNGEGQVVGSERRELTFEPQQGEVCVGDGRETLRALTTEEEPCCLPYTLPPLPPVCEPDSEPPFEGCEWDTEVCEWECPTCEQRNPETEFGGDGTWSVVRNDGTDGDGRPIVRYRADVSGIPFEISGAAFDGEVQIYWVNGNSTFVKQRREVSTECGETLSSSITWSNGSHRHTCSATHVNPNVQYFLRIVDSGGTVRYSEELSRTGGLCSVD